MVSVISGASSGIGRAVALEFARQGMEVVILARRLEELEKLCQEMEAFGTGKRFRAFACDVRKASDLAAVAQKVEKEFGRVNIFYANAGAYHYGELLKCSPETIENLVDTNVKGTIFACQAFLPLVEKAVAQQEWAKVVLMSSLGGVWGFHNMAVYSASKFAVAGFGSALERELAPKGIGVGIIYPGPVDKQRKPRGKKLTLYPEEVAVQVHRLATTHQRREYTRPLYRGLSLLERFAPKWVDRIFTRSV